MNNPPKKDLYTIMTEEWARAPLDYLATTHHAIVSRFEESFRYVSLRSENANTFSYEFASMLRDACSAFGSFSAALMGASGFWKGQKKQLTMKDFFVFYSSHLPDLCQSYIEVRSVPGACRLKPFSDWTEKKVPVFWKAHNDIKHSEYACAGNGNLRNTTNAVAAVEIVLRCATQDQKGTRFFSHWGLDQPGAVHIRLLFDP